MPSGFFVKWNELILKFHMEIHRAQNIYNSLKKNMAKRLRLTKRHSN